MGMAPVVTLALLFDYCYLILPPARVCCYEPQLTLQEYARKHMADLYSICSVDGYLSLTKFNWMVCNGPIGSSNYRLALMAQGHEAAAWYSNSLIWLISVLKCKSSPELPLSPTGLITSWSKWGLIVSSWPFHYTGTWWTTYLVVWSFWAGNLDGGARPDPSPTVTSLRLLVGGPNPSCILPQHLQCLGYGCLLYIVITTAGGVFDLLAGCNSTSCWLATLPLAASVKVEATPKITYCTAAPMNRGNTRSRLYALQQINHGDARHVNGGLISLLGDIELLVVAYEFIRSKPGNMTPGVSDETLDGLSF